MPKSSNSQNPRIEKLVSQFSSLGIDAFLVTKDVNITYLTGFNASESWLFVTPKESFYITDFRYILEAEQGLKGIKIKKYDRSMIQAAFELAKDLVVGCPSYLWPTRVQAEKNSDFQGTRKQLKYKAFLLTSRN